MCIPEVAEYDQSMLDLIIAGLALLSALILALMMIGGAGIYAASGRIDSDAAFMQWAGAGFILAIIIAIYFFYRFYRYDEKDVMGHESI